MKTSFARTWGMRLGAVIATLAAPALAGAQEGGWNGGESARDVVSGETMVVLAYGAIWVILLAFVLRSWLELRALRKETDELKRLVEESAPRPRA